MNEAWDENDAAALDDRSGEELVTESAVEPEPEVIPSGDKTRIRWIIGAILLVILLVGGAIAGWTFLGVGSFTTLDTANPAIVHPDGLAVRLADGTSSIRVQIASLPRETFVGGQAGRQWEQARAALSPRIAPLSPVYTIIGRGGGLVVAEMAIPNGAEPLQLLDLYRWDAKTKTWVFQPFAIDPARQVIVFHPSSLPISVIAAHTQPQQTAIGLIVDPGGPAPGSQYGLTILRGVSLSESGTLVSEPAAGTGSTVLVMVENRDGAMRNYESAPQRSTVITQLVELMTPYDGLVLDFDPGLAYPDFIRELSEQVHRHGKRLEIGVRGPDLAPYTLGELGTHVDRVWLAPGDNPTGYLPTQSTEALLDQIVGQVNRDQLGLLVGAGHVEVIGETARPITTQEALTPFGGVELVEGYVDLSQPLAPGSSVPLRLSGQIASMGFDSGLGMNYLTYYDQSGQLHYVYFGSAQGITLKLNWAHVYGLGSVAVAGVADPDALPGLADGISAFASQQPAASPDALVMTWRVQAESGAELSREQGDLTFIQYLWQVVTDPGRYTISAAINGPSGENGRGQIVVEVGQAQSATPGPTPTVSPTPTATRNPNATPAPTATPAAQPTVGGGVAPGSFELGGQTHTLDHPSEMRRAGMTWVKFQHKWGPGDSPTGAIGDRISRGHAAGFKVLLSVPGPLSPTSIDFDQYVDFLAGVAALGPDAIEVWNEMNFSREWPKDDINGASYVNKMLAPAYQAIKGVNSSIIVISGAPTPSGAFGGCGVAPTGEAGCDDWIYLQQMRDAGAANYMDCMGIHFNSGATSPAATTGHPADAGDHHYTWYYQPMVNLYYGTIGRPLCFTELGFLSPDGYGPLPPNFWWGGETSVSEHAQWLAEAAVLASQSGKVRLMIIFNVDIFDYGADPQGGYAIVRPGGSCPACDTLDAVMP